MFGYMYWGTTEYWDNQPLYIVICEIVLWYIYLTRTCVVGWWVSAVATCWVSCASARCGGSWSWCSWLPGPPRPAAPPPPPWGWRPRWTESNPGPPTPGTLKMKPLPAFLGSIPLWFAFKEEFPSKTNSLQRIILFKELFPSKNYSLQRINPIKESFHWGKNSL